MPRPRWIALGALALVLGLLPFVPRGGGGDDGTIRTTADRPTSRTLPLTAGYGRVTPAFRRTIDRVVAEARSEPRLSRTASAKALVDSVVRCATFVFGETGSLPPPVRGRIISRSPTIPAAAIPANAYSFVRFFRAGAGTSA